MSLLEGRLYSGPAFTFPKAIARPSGTVFIDDLQSLERHFTGWKAGEIPGASPIVAVVEEGVRRQRLLLREAFRRGGRGRA